MKSLEDQPDTKLEVSRAGSRVRAAECYRSACQTTEVAVIVLTQAIQPKAFERRDVVGKSTPCREAGRQRNAKEVARHCTARLARTRRKTKGIDHVADVTEDRLAGRCR